MAQNLRDAHIEISSCGICGEAKADILFAVEVPLGPEIFKYCVVQCRQCRTAYLTPRPTAGLFDLIYPPENYYAYRENSQKGMNCFKGWVMRASLPGSNMGPVPRWLARALSSQIMTFVPAARGEQRLLDIGCGSGDFLQQARAAGWQVWGVDPSRAAAKKARQRGLEVFCDSINEAPFPRKFFDFICLSHVIEHFEDPLVELLECGNLLKDNGKLLVTTPNFECFDRYTFGPHWRSLCIPQHLWFFSPQTLEMVLQKTGFRVESRKFALLPHKKDDLSMMHFKGLSLKGRTLAKAVMRTFLIKPCCYLLPGKHSFLGDTMSVIAAIKG